MDLRVVAHTLEFVNHGPGMLVSLGLLAVPVLWLAGQPVRSGQRRAHRRSRSPALLILSALFFSSGLAATAAQASEDPGLTCDRGDTGIWAPLSVSNHDNLVLLTKSSRIIPGDAVTFTLEWEWRDWRPGTPLHIRACTDIDGERDVDAKATPPHEGPQFDFDTTHPKDPPDNRAGKKDRPVVRHPITFRVPKDLAPGELCTRVAVTGNPQDHVGSPPKYDLAQTVCLPITASPPPSPSPSPSPPPIHPSPPPTPPGPPSVHPSAPGGGALPAPPTHPAKLPVTGGVNVKLVALALGLLGAGTVVELKTRRARKVAAGAPRA